MINEQLGATLRELSTQSSVIKLKTEDQQKVERLVAELKSIFEPYSKN